MTQERKQFSVLKIIEDMRREDAAFVADMVALFGIVRTAFAQTAKQPCAKDHVKGMRYADDAFDIAIKYLETRELPKTLADAAHQLDTKGKLSAMTTMSLVGKYAMMGMGLQKLGDVLKETDHPVTKALAAEVVGHPDFICVFTRIQEKAEGKMLRMVETPSGGLDVFESLSGQNLRLFEIDKVLMDQINTLGEGKVKIVKCAAKPDTPPFKHAA